MPDETRTTAARVLVVEDEAEERRVLVRLLRGQGYSVYEAESADKALSYVEEGPDLVLSDLGLGDQSGLDLLDQWRKRRADTPFIVLTGDTTLSHAVAAVKAGAYDYLTKPVNLEELLLVLRRALEERRKDRELEELRRRLDERFGLENIIGQSAAMQRVFALIRRAAPVDSTVLILGESGTGKELVAQALHQNSLRKKGPFVAVNCAAVPATLVESELFGHVRGAFTGATDRRMGRFEQADGGTLFVDEIGDFELGLQAKLLRVLETRKFTPVGGHEEQTSDVRVIAATSRDLVKMVREGKFREDLYYRLNVISVQLPALRERSEDIPLLVDHFVKEISRQKGAPPRRIDPAVMERLAAYRWPGNVRELRNVLERMMVLATGEELTEEDLPEEILQVAVPPAGPVVAAPLPAEAEGGMILPPGLTMDQIEQMVVLGALEKTGGNRTQAARALGMSVRTLQRKLQRYGMAAGSAEEPEEVQPTESARP